MISQISSNTSWASQGVSVSSAAQRHQEMFAKLDTNGDQKIDLVELQAGAPTDGKGKDAAAIMKEADTSGDGTIDAAENETFLSKMDSKAKPSGSPPSGMPPGGAKGAGSSEDSTDKVYDKLDTNKDGVVSLLELLAATDSESVGPGIQDLLKSLTVNAQSYNEEGAGVIDAAGGVVDTVA